MRMYMWHAYTCRHIYRHIKTQQLQLLRLWLHDYAYKNAYFKSKPTEEITFALDNMKQYSLAG